MCCYDVSRSWWCYLQLSPTQTRLPTPPLLCPDLQLPTQLTHTHIVNTISCGYYCAITGLNFRHVRLFPRRLWILAQNISTDLTLVMIPVTISLYPSCIHSWPPPLQPYLGQGVWRCQWQSPTWRRPARPAAAAGAGRSTWHRPGWFQAVPAAPPPTCRAPPTGSADPEAPPPTQRNLWCTWLQLRTATWEAAREGRQQRGM